MSLLEAVVNTGVGFVLSWGIQAVLFHVYHIRTSTSTDLQLVLWFTIASVLRSYLMRRLFNRFWMRGVK